MRIAGALYISFRERSRQGAAVWPSFEDGALPRRSGGAGGGRGLCNDKPKLPDLRYHNASSARTGWCHRRQRAILVPEKVIECQLIMCDGEHVSVPLFELLVTSLPVLLTWLPV